MGNQIPHKLLTSEEGTLNEVAGFMVVTVAMMKEWFEHVTKMGSELVNRADKPLETCSIMPCGDRLLGSQ